MEKIVKEKLVKELNELLNSEFTQEFFDLLDADDIISDRLKNNNLLFQQKVKELKNISAKDNLNTLIQQQIVLIEQQLTDYFKEYQLYTSEGYQKFIDNIFQRFQPREKLGFFLNMTAAKRILQLHPPKGLMDFLDVKIIEDLFEIMSPLDVVTLSRNTEAPAWQAVYKNELFKLTKNDFEARPIGYLILDFKKYAHVIRNSGQPEKPWRLSHNKITGSIMCFNVVEPGIFITPFLQYAAVFLHYCFETFYAGRYYSLIAEVSPEKLGKAVVNSFTEHDGKFSFFNPNVYSEAVYWEDAISLLIKEFKFSGLDFFADTIDCGGFYGDGQDRTAVSLNLADHLWNVNLKKTIFLYHFREDWWKRTLQAAVRLTDVDFTAETVHNLSLRDQEFTDYIINKARVK